MTEPLFESTFKLERNPAPLIVNDFNVAVHDILRWYQDKISGSFQPEVEAKLVKGAFALQVNRGPNMLPRHSYRILFVADSRFAHTGNYWRNDVMSASPVVAQAWVNHAEEQGVKLETLKTNYKGNRKPKTDEFWFVYNICRNYAEEYFPFFEEEGMEADDWCGSIYRLSRDSEDKSVVKQRQILLTTCDRDWSQCVDESHRVYFANTRVPFASEKIQARLVDNEGVRAHTKWKMGFDLNHPSELPKFKSLYSDEGDNLPKGTPLELFDLCEPHPIYNIENAKQRAELIECVNNPGANCRPDHFDQALRQFARVMLEAPIKL
jgi:hypothetical protein